MAKADVPPYLAWLEEVVGVADGLDSAEKQTVVDALRALARRVRRSDRRWHEHVFALAIARYAFAVKLPERVAERMPILVCLEEGKLHAYVTDSERSSFPLADASLRLVPMNLLGLVQTIEAFRSERWRSDEYQAATHLADAQIHLHNEDSALSRDILQLVARCLYGMIPVEPLEHRLNRGT